MVPGYSGLGGRHELFEVNLLNNCISLRYGPYVCSAHEGASTYGSPWTSHPLQAPIDDWIASVPDCAAGVREGRAAAAGRVAL